jgi:hypothetical protein
VCLRQYKRFAAQRGNLSSVNSMKKKEVPAPVDGSRRAVCLTVMRMCTLHSTIKRDGPDQNFHGSVSVLLHPSTTPFTIRFSICDNAGLHLHGSSLQIDAMINADLSAK